MRMQRATLQAHVELALRDRQAVTLVYLNIQGFRSINRQYGPEGADEILWALGERLAAAFGPAAVARLPGDEFVLALVGDAADAADAESASALGEVARLISAPFVRPDGSLSLSAAIGAASSPQDGVAFQQLFERAESAMLDARMRHTGAVPQAKRRPAPGAAEELRAALEQRQFVLHYQPQIDLRSGAVVGVEALIRWVHPELGLLSPGAFIEAAEQTGMIVPIGRWVLQEACREAARWRAGGHGNLMVAVNLSARQFENGELEHAVQDALRGAGLPPSCLELEMTETVLIHDTDNVLKQIRQLKQMGLTLSLDDFGTGYSSLSYLKKFAVDKIKIDRSFVSGLGKDANDAAIVRAIVQIAHSLGLRTVAEGVEDACVLSCLQLLGCDEVQGHHFSPPLAASAFRKMLTVLARDAAPRH
ncbi:MAG TPA: GGDEF domain-containing phosphodiesterase [Telluria sp.]